ncbi:hypothetical protein DFH05DRAFT_144484 [Lentinula detonsa]|uniref:Uncharacterized protein n=1 Tax=Lentinula detonsa TaxID=2804962 RepID=A0A9W8U3B5_9AGAR|nr:hypothetical protein DFH05DRAFT_144484 [Lentinula detonsa]
MSGYYSSSELSGMRAPRKPLMKSVALPVSSPMNSPTSPNFPRNEPARPSSRFPWISANFFPRSQSPAPPPSQRPNPSYHEVATTASSNTHVHHTHTTSRTRKTSVSSNISDHSNAMPPLKGILKKAGSSSRSSTPNPSAMNPVPPVRPESAMHAMSSSSGESSSVAQSRHRRSGSGSKTSSNSSSKIDGYASGKRSFWSSDSSLNSSLNS